MPGPRIITLIPLPLGPVTGTCGLCGDPAYNYHAACPDCRAILSTVAHDGSILPVEPGEVN